MFKVGDIGYTRDGDRYTIVSTTSNNEFCGFEQPILAKVVSQEGGTERIYEYTVDGFYYEPSEPQDEDLMPPMRRGADQVSANCTIVSLLLAAGHVTEEQVEAAKRLAEMTR